MKKFLSYLLMLILVASCLSIPAAANAEDWITLRVECFDRSVSGLSVESNLQHDYIQKNFGDPNHIKVELVPVSRWSETDILNTWLAGGTAPDICYTYDTALVQQYVNMGGLTPLNDLLAEYGPNVSEFLGQGVLEYGQFDENGTKVQYYIPARRINVAKLGLFIRKDWLDKLNMAEPTTTEEWVAYLRAAKEAKLGGEQTFPYAMKLYENSPLFSTSVIVDSFLDFSKITKEDWYSLYHEQMPGAKEAYRLLNTLYNEGLISENFAIDNGDIRDRDLNQGYAGFYIEGPTQVWPDYSDEMKKNVGEDAEWIPVNPFVNPDGYTLHENYAANGICIFIPSWVNKETAVAAMKYMDWMAQPENMFYLQNGIEGVHYDHLNEDGLPVGRVTNDNLPDDQKWLSAVDLVFLSNGNSFGNDELNNKYSALAFTGYEDVVARSYEYMAKDSYAPIGFTVSIKAEADYGQMVLAKQAELLTNALTCDPAEFDAVYDRCVQAILDVGGQQIVDERKAAYEAGLIRGDFPMEVLSK